MPFRDRIEAGALLAAKLTRYARHPGGLVLALPRGGVPVGHAVAQRLHLPLDVLIVRKLGVPGREELAMGAIASGGARVMNDGIVAALHVSKKAIAAVQAREQAELERRERLYRGSQPAPDPTGRTVLLVDDGIATGATVRAAILALRAQGATRIVVATPVAAREVGRALRETADEFVAVLEPEDFQSVGEWYADFAQVTDAEVAALLGKKA